MPHFEHVFPTVEMMTGVLTDVVIRVRTISSLSGNGRRVTYSSAVGSAASFVVTAISAASFVVAIVLYFVVTIVPCLHMRSIDTFPGDP